MLYRVILVNSDKDDETHSILIDAESPKRAGDRVLDFASRGVYLNLGIAHDTRVRLLTVN